MYNTLIIDDESNARNALKNLLAKHCPEILVKGEANCVADGVALIKAENPDLVFLDVQMPDGTGFDLLEKIGNVKFKVIFASAYDKFAIQAFRFSAIDYLQKPVEPEKLVDACSKLVPGDDRYEELNKKLEVLLSNKNSFEKIALPTLDGIIFVKIKDIMHCESDNNYTNFFLKEGKKIIVSKTLKEYDEMLTPFNFFRIHKSHLINLAYLERYKKGEGGFVVMENGAELEVSRRRKEDFMKALQSA
ncbi:MAG: LytTR family DNA-binding domain-containing protein [Bacteroidales bacterium]|nr:LytTR family DNA-binding domain-containing protein [Bacteroidales bacterium]